MSLVSDSITLLNDIVSIYHIFGMKWPNHQIWRNVALRHDIRPSMVTHTQNLCSAINPSKVRTHTVVNTHTHTVNTHLEQWAANAAVPGEQLGVQFLLKGLTSVVVLKVKRALDIHSPHLQFLPARDSNSQLLGYESDSLTIRPRLPHTLHHSLTNGSSAVNGCRQNEISNSW